MMLRVLPWSLWPRVSNPGPSGAFYVLWREGRRSGSHGLDSGGGNLVWLVAALWLACLLPTS